MKNNKRNKIIGFITISINLLLVFDSIYWYYLYNFERGLLFLFKRPDWVLIVNFLLAIVGVYMSILLIRNKIRLIPFLMTTLLFWLIAWSNLFFPIY